MDDTALSGSALKNSSTEEGDEYMVSHFASNCVNDIKTSLLAVDESNMEERRRLLRNCILEKLELPVTTEIPALTTYLNNANYVLGNEFLEGIDGGGRRRMHKRTTRRNKTTGHKRRTMRRNKTRNKTMRRPKRSTRHSRRPRK